MPGSKAPLINCGFLIVGQGIARNIQNEPGASCIARAQRRAQNKHPTPDILIHTDDNRVSEGHRCQLRDLPWLAVE